MKCRPFAALLLLVVLAGLSAPSFIAAASASHTTPPKIGQQAPAFSLRDQNGKRVSLAAAGGAKVVLVFYRGYW